MGRGEHNGPIYGWMKIHTCLGCRTFVAAARKAKEGRESLALMIEEEEEFLFFGEEEEEEEENDDDDASSKSGINE